jgi:hypothetical protein
MKITEPSDPWSSVTWEGAELAQLRREAAQPFSEHLMWLEEMTEFAERFSKAPSIKEASVPSVNLLIP